MNGVTNRLLQLVESHSGIYYIHCFPLITCLREVVMTAKTPLTLVAAGLTTETARLTAAFYSVSSCASLVVQRQRLCCLGHQVADVCLFKRT